MENDEILQIVSILSVKFPDNIPEEFATLPIVDILKNTTFPDIKHFETVGISVSQLQKKSNAEISKSLLFEFNFSTEVLEFFISYTSKTPEAEYYIDVYILVSFAYWFLQYEQTKSSENALLLLKSMHRIVNTNFKKKSTQLFSIIMNVYINSPQFVSKEVMPLIPRIIQELKTEWMYFSKWVLTFISILLQPENKTLFEEFASELTPEVNKSTDPIKQSEFTSLCHILGRDIMELNNTEIKVFTAFIHHYKEPIGTDFLDFAIVSSFLKTFIPTSFGKTTDQPEIPEIGFHQGILYSVDVTKLFDKLPVQFDDVSYFEFQIKPEFKEQHENLLSILTEKCSVMDIMTLMKKWIAQLGTEETILNNISFFTYILDKMDMTPDEVREYIKTVAETCAFSATIYVTNIIKLQRSIVYITRKAQFSGIPFLVKTIKNHKIIYNIVRVLFVNFDLLGKEIFNSSEILKSIVQLFFSAVETQGTEKILNDVYLFVMKTINVSENANVCFSLLEFNSLIVYFIIDDLIRPKVLEFLKTFMLNELSSFGMAFPSAVSSLLQTLTVQYSFAHSRNIANEILETLNYCLLERPALVLMFSNIHPVLKLLLQNIGESDIDYKILVNIIKFTKIVISDVNCDPSIIQIIIKKTLIMKNENFHDAVQSELYELAIYKNPMEIIRFSSLLTIILQRYKSKEDKILFIRMIHAIIKVSRNNLMELLNSKFDEYLLDEIANFGTNEGNNDELVEAYLDLLTEIHSKAASTASVSKYITLFSPYEGKYIHPNILSIYNHFIETVERYMIEPVPYIPLKSGSPTIEMTIKEKSFILSVYMFIEPYNCINYDTIWTVKAANTTVSLCIQNLKFVFSFNFKNNLQSLNIRKQNMGYWFWLNVLISFEPNLIRLKFIDENVDDIVFPFEYNNEDIIITVGPSNPKNNQVPIAYISDAIISKSDQQPLNFKNHDNHIAYFTLSEKNRRINLKSPFETIKLVGPTNIRSSAFPSIFAHTVGFRFFSIIFAEENMQAVNKRKIENLLIHILKGLTRLFQAYTRLEFYFFKGDCTAVLCYFLMNHEKTIELFTTIKEFSLALHYTKLKNEVFKNVLLSFLIWRTAPQNVLVHVTSQWISLLTKQTYPLFEDAIPLIAVLREIRLQSSLEEPCIPIISNYSAIASNMILLANTSYNFECLVGEIVSSSTAQQTIMLNTILQSVLTSEHIAESHVRDKEACFFLLQSILRIPDESLLIMILDCIILAHTRHIFDTIPLFYHVTIVQRMILPEMLSMNAINLISAKTSCTSELVGILVKMASQIGQEALNSAAKSIKLNDSFSSIELVSFVNELFFYSDKSSLTKYFEFLDKFVPNALQILKANEIFEIFLTSEYALHLMQTNNTNYTLDEIISMILFTCKKNISENFYKAYQNSPFSKQKKRAKIFIPLEEKILNMVKVNPSYVYYIRLDQNNKWMDHYLAKIILDKALQEQTKTDNFPIDENLKDLLILTMVRCGDESFAHLLKDPTVLMVADYFRFNFTHSEKYIANIQMPKIIKYFETIEFPYEKKVGKIYTYLHEYLTNQEDIVNKNMQMTKADEFIDGYYAENSKTFDSFQDLTKSYEIKWKKLLREFTQKHAPWYQYFVPENERKTHLMRDDVIVKGVPCKLIMNSNFDDHLMASLIRDTGGQKEAEKLMQERLLQEQNINKKKIIPIGIEIPKFDSEKEANSPSKKDKIKEKSFDCQKVTVTGVEECKLEFGLFISIKTAKSTISFEKEEVQAIYLRTFLQKPTALEIFLDYVSYFLNFDISVLNNVFKYFEKVIPRNVVDNKLPKVVFSSLDFTDKWISGEITNFEYLIALNKYSGRSFNDPAQYPMMPWVILDYDSEKIDLNDKKLYRNMSKPVGALDNDRLEILKKNADNRNVGLPKENWFLYGTGPICPMQVYGYFVRLEPFTSMHIQFQGGKFDNSSRIFKSIQQCFKNCTHNLQSFYELTPEFYISPEFLTNSEHFDLGTGDEGNVKLPSWSKTDYEFIYLNRKALESDFVSSNLHNWIDLIWGYKQNGQKAIEADNVFDPSMYETFVVKDSDIALKLHTETVRKEVGQIPTQMFFEPHKQRNVVKNSFQILKEISINLGEMQSLGWIVSQQVDSKLSLKVIMFSNSNLDIFYKINLGTSDFDVEERFQAPVKNFEHMAAKSFEKIFTYDIENNTISSFNYFKKTVKNSEQLYGFVNNLSTDGNYVSVASDDGTILILDSDTLQTVFRLSTYGDSPILIDINSVFDLVVVSTELGSLHFISLHHQSILRTVYLQGKISLLKISPGWGFVLVYVVRGEESEFRLYSMNGELIRSSVMTDQIKDIVLYSDRNGFDFCICLTQKWKVFTFELFYLMQQTKILFYGNFPLMKIEFVKDINCVICFGKKSKVVVVPI
ncbi:Beige/BEACH domain containing protein [Trichomonas vaginalis G3]|uniref:Beige/BEACH domain containing protein n=1 Tax=Trichomonas vaginalis (strain ATCC PRA-98 / G3) TaxID=412133 RepID=A2EEZ4_TRIV3|nr:beige/BEACH-related family [Trichomonas vaginalis G3]EAY08792.1 Beige/BEACH domain containing protein [Trichomonas vaginalis G3]KAI5515112.1 beige/BEACH-related family [Trichomonas vaginalis G3]|eukprot:XP_001321015.1 Beige/BEACH domain containing protein [Trichomonas vaginalis G3]